MNLQTCGPAFGTHVASSVLFNRRVALGALFCVCRDPVARFRIISALLEPAFDNRAAAWSMVRLPTAEAERVVTVALDCWNDCVELS